MWIIKKLFIIAVVLLIVAPFFAGAGAKIKIGILMWSEEGRYAEALSGFMEQLKQDGYGEAQVTFTMENAKGSKVKAAELAHKFATAKMDMIVALGTSAAIGAIMEIKDVPVVYNFIYDPVDAKIAMAWQSSGNNSTGTSAKFPMSKLVSNLKQLTPVKKLAVLYTPGERNSESQLKELQGIQEDFQIKVIPVPLTREEDIAQMIPEVSRTVDAIYFSGSNLVAEKAQMIVDIAIKAKVIMVTHVEDLVAKGVLLGVCANPRLVGRLAGKKAVKILRGAKPSSIPIETLKKMDIVINMKTAKAGQFQIPQSFMKKVTKIIE